MLGQTIKMSDFRFSVDDLFKDFNTLMDTTATQQTKQIAPYVGPNTNLSTTQSQRKDFDPTNTTIFSVSEIFQNIPAYQSTARVQSTFEDALSKNVAPRIGGVVSSTAGPDFAYLKNLLPEDVSLDGTSETSVTSTDPNSGISTSPDAAITGPVGTTPRPSTAAEKQVAQAVLSHTNLLGIVSKAKDDVNNDKISPFMMATLKFLMDRGVKLWITCLLTGHSTTTKSGNTSLHISGRAADIRPTGGSGSIASNNTWIDQVYQLLDTRAAPIRPKEVLGPYVYGGGGKLGASHYYTGKNDSRGTYWGTAPDHQNHIHFGITDWGTE